MKVLFDTNVVLDIALNRRPFVEDASLLLRLAEQKEIRAYLSNTCITDIFYIINKHAGKQKARGFIVDILDTFKLVDIDEEGFREALTEDMADYRTCADAKRLPRTAEQPEIPEPPEML
jgi:predicted nucleic acid-binding protein